MPIEEPCPYCKGYLEIDFAVKTKGNFIHYTCLDCKRKWISIAKNINDIKLDKIKNYKIKLGEYDNDSRNDEIQTSGSEDAGEI